MKFLVIAFLMMFAFSGMLNAITMINSCRNLNVANEEYRLTADVTSANNCFNITAQGVTLDCQGHSITGQRIDYTYGIYATNDRIKVRNCRVSNFYSGVQYVSRRSGAQTIFSWAGWITYGEIKNVTSFSNVVSGFDTIYSGYDTFTNNKAEANNVGFFLDSYNDRVVNNTAQGNTNQGFLLIAYDALNNTVANNTASNNGQIFGFQFQNFRNSRIENNIAQSNKGTGFGLKTNQGTCDNNVITGNTARSNTDNEPYGKGNGFSLEDCSNNILSNNMAETNGVDGFYLGRSSGNTLTNNTAESNGMDGFFLDTSLNNVLKSNTAKSNQYGFGLLYSSNNILTSNTAEKNSGNAFDISHSVSNTLNSNTAKTSINGFAIDSSSGNTLTSNTAESNSRSGFYIQVSDSNTLTSNTADSNKGDGFDLSSSSGNDLTSNMAKLNSGDGFLFNFNSNNNKITSNTADSNLGGGFALGMSNNNIVTYNLILHNAKTQIEMMGGVVTTGNLFHHNNITGSFWVIDYNFGASNRYDTGLDNANDLGKEGNIYYFENGTPSWKVYDIQDGNPVNNWADAGTQRPFDNRIPEWQGGNRDWHPYVERVETTCEQSSVPACIGTCPKEAYGCAESYVTNSCNCLCSNIGTYSISNIKYGNEHALWDFSPNGGGKVSFVYNKGQNEITVIYYDAKGNEVSREKVPALSYVTIKDKVTGRTWKFRYRLDDKSDQEYAIGIDKQTPDDCPAGQIFNETTCSCQAVETTCDQSSVPACGGYCPNSNEHCQTRTVMRDNNPIRTCGCICIPPTGLGDGWVGVGKIMNDLAELGSLQLRLVKIIDGSPPSAVLDILDKDGNLLQTVTLKLGESYEIFDPINGFYVNINIENIFIDTNNPNLTQVEINLPHCPAGEVLDLTTCSCQPVELKCEETFPACGGICKDDKKTCIGSSIDCMCGCKNLEEITLKQGEVFERNGIGIEVKDIWPSGTKPVVFDIRVDGILKDQKQLEPGESFTYVFGGRELLFRVLRTDPDAKTVTLSIMPECPAGKTFNQDTCTCECSNQTAKAECKYPDKWDDNTCSCTKAEFCGKGTDEKVCIKACPIEAFSCQVDGASPTGCACNCQLDASTCKDPKYFNKDVCACECPGVDKKILKIGEIASNSEFDFKLTSIDNSVYPPLVHIDIYDKQGNLKWGYDVPAGAAIVTFGNFKVLRISEDGTWAEIVIYGDVCPDKKIFNGDTCNCTCNANEKWACEGKGGKWDDVNCECAYTPCALDGTANACLGDCPANSQCTLSEVPTGGIKPGEQIDMKTICMCEPKADIGRAKLCSEGGRNADGTCGIDDCKRGTKCDPTTCTCKPTEFCGEGADKAVCAYYCKNPVQNCLTYGKDSALYPGNDNPNIPNVCMCSCYDKLYTVESGQASGTGFDVGQFDVESQIGISAGISVKAKGYGERKTFVSKTVAKDETIYVNDPDSGQALTLHVVGIENFIGPDGKPMKVIYFGAKTCPAGMVYNDTSCACEPAKTIIKKDETPCAVGISGASVCPLILGKVVLAGAKIVPNIYGGCAVGSCNFATGICEQNVCMGTCPTGLSCSLGQNGCVCLPTGSAGAVPSGGASAPIAQKTFKYWYEK